MCTVMKRALVREGCGKSNGFCPVTPYKLLVSSAPVMAILVMINDSSVTLIISKLLAGLGPHPLST